ncbi:MAG: apolipoprotein N-acyltransferase [Bdellovibrionales bacterium]|nr:apolipoprotein N-acyltransferase [Bdellovibrionales bacterium]
MFLPLALTLLAGVLYVFSFAPWDQGYLQWIAFVPLFVAIQKVQDSEHPKCWQRYFWLGFVMNLVICIGGFYWIIYSTQQYGGLPLWASLLLFAVFCLIGQLQIPIYLWVREWAKKSKKFDESFWCWPIFSGFVYAGIESIYPKLFSDTAGNAFYRHSWIRQAADLGGPFVLTAISISVNEWITRSILYKELRSIIAAVSMIVAVCLYGSYRVNQYTYPETLTGPTFNIALIQANIGDYLKLEAERGSESAIENVLQAYLSLGSQAIQNAQKPDMIVWPETAYPALFGKPMSPPEVQLERVSKNFARQFGGTWAFGGYDQDVTLLEYNSFFFYDPVKDTHQVYHKSHLLMFGETLPFADLFPSMKSWFPTMGFFGQGPGPIVVSVRNTKGVEFKFAPNICYEDLFNDFGIEGANLGADALINVTNDSWFGPDGEPYLHLALSTYRSIETRLPFLRATNTGFSVLVDPTGEIRKTTSLNNPEVLHAQIPKRFESESPYQKIARALGALGGGHWFEHLCQLILVCVLIHLKFY